MKSSVDHAQREARLGETKVRSKVEEIERSAEVQMGAPELRQTKGDEARASAILVPSELGISRG